MTRALIFSDEAGCFAFNKGPRASKYFMVCTVLLPSAAIGDKLLELRRDMLWRKLPLRPFFHATEDKQAVRNEVYELLAKEDFRIDVTILEKSKAQPQTRPDQQTFYKYAWYYHFKHVGPALLKGATEAHIFAASIGTNKGQAAYTAAVNDVMQQTVQRQQWVTAFPQSVAEPCLQVADYCAWAIQRKWERNDVRSYDLISEKIATEYDLWARGGKHFYDYE